MTEKDSVNKTMRYAGLASTWLAALLVTVWLGYKLDAWLLHFPLFIIVFPVITLVLLLWQVIKEFGNPKK
jgi:F0F1-type ATP synthase assembly protein I